MRTPAITMSRSFAILVAFMVAAGTAEGQTSGAHTERVRSRLVKHVFAFPRSAPQRYGELRRSPEGEHEASSMGQGSSLMARGERDEWTVGLYPIFVWLPYSIGIDVTVPPDDNGNGGGHGEIIDSRFDGAYFGGFYASKNRFRLDADGLWAGFGGDRPSLPFLRVDVDAIYFHTTAGVRLGGDLYAVGGVRRIALKYNISIADFPAFERKPGVWDPVIGLAWHTEGGRLLEFHAVFEGGGFGVGSEKELAASARLDLKPFEHFGITAGYAALNIEVENTVANRTFKAEQTLQGPIFGIGFYF